MKRPNPKKDKQARRVRHPLPVTARVSPPRIPTCAECMMRPRENGRLCRQCREEHRHNTEDYNKNI